MQKFWGEIGFLYIFVRNGNFIIFYMELIPGIYEQIVNKLFSAKLGELNSEQFYIGKKPIGKKEAIELLTKYLSHLFEIAFEHADENQSPDVCISFVNKVIETLGSTFNVADADLNLVDASNSILTAIVDRHNFDFPDIEEYLERITPSTSLSCSTVFFGGHGPVDIHTELNREILSADEICWVVSFIKVSGLNLLWDSLRYFTAKGKRLRIVTTTYTGATDFDAIVKLSSLPNTEIKISYDGSQDRLHAKSYIFLRNSGFNTAYIGSSNLSRYALTDGKEWNIKVSQFQLPDVISAVRASFESYWEDETK